MVLSQAGMLGPDSTIDDRRDFNMYTAPRGEGPAVSFLPHLPPYSDRC